MLFICRRVSTLGRIRFLLLHSAGTVAFLCLSIHYLTQCIHCIMSQRCYKKSMFHCDDKYSLLPELPPHHPLFRIWNDIYIYRWKSCLQLSTSWLKLTYRCGFDCITKICKHLALSFDLNFP